MYKYYMFTSNKYSKFYYSIINNAKQLNRARRGHERHHILPRSMGGSDESDNLVNLTMREHYICHLLLTKFTVGEAKKKMFYAAHRIINSRPVTIKNSRMYEYVRKNRCAFLSDRYKDKSYLETRGKHYAHEISEYQKEQIRKSNSLREWTDESKLKMGSSQRRRKVERPESFAKGPFTQEHKDNISKAALGKGEKFTFIHEIHGMFTGTNQELIRAYPAIFDKKCHGAEVWKLSKGLYKSCKGWRMLSI